MSWGMVAVAGASVVSGAMGASAAKSGSKMQADATREANELQKQQYDQTRADLEPYRNFGNSATSKLAMLLGLDMPGGYGAGGAGSVESRDAIRARLESQFQTQKNPIWALAGGNSEGGSNGSDYYISGYADGTDETGLNAAIDAELARQRAAQQQGTRAAQSDPAYGSLLKNFTGQDLENEPGYQFGLKQGQNGLNNRLASAGSYFSGAALKAASRYNQDYAGTKFGEAFNRDAANKQRTYNFLSGAVGTGQNSAAMTGQAGANMANAVGANTTAMGNAQAAAGISQANTWGNALQNVAGAYQQGQLTDRILGGNRGFGSMVSEGMRTNGMAGYNSIYG